ncbi:MAG: aspartate-semialdehyde dehydrogenase [Spirochaetales bacterium]|nr:aspartate-semialdehyde dehydrogenase [Spirochaetales bacterium]
MSKLKAGIIGGTGMVGQRFVSLLENHPFFEVTCIAASVNSANKTYEEAVKGRWAMPAPIPNSVKTLMVKDASQTAEISNEVDFVFCAVDMPKSEVLKLEEAFAKHETPVVSNNSAARPLPDVPMMIPEINAHHIGVIAAQKKRLGTSRGFIVVKPNCSLQSYVPAIHPLLEYAPTHIVACTYQAISGAGKTFETWPEMIDNVIPFIGGEEEKSEKEPMKIWGTVADGNIVNALEPVITSQCIRVPISDGHMAAVFISFKNKPSKNEILAKWKAFEGKPQRLNLPSAPKPFLTYFEEDSRPQTKLDRDIGNGMGVAIGRLREDSLYDYKFVCLSHNTIRGAAGGAVLIAELLKAEDYLVKK